MFHPLNPVIAMNLTPEEFLQLHRELPQPDSECERLREEVRKLRQEVEHYKRLLMAKVAETVGMQAGEETLVVLPISGVRKVLGQADTLEHISLVLHAVLKMLPVGAPPELVKQLVDAAPAGVRLPDPVQVIIDRAADVVAGGGVKNVNVHTLNQPIGETNHDTDRNCER